MTARLVEAVKVCPRCRVERPLSGFARDASKASGRKSHCRECDNAKGIRYYEANRQNVIERVSALARSKREPRKCATCDAPATSSRHHYCDGCRAAVEARDRSRARRRERERTRIRATSTERGYGADHQRLRQALAAQVSAGLADCARCGERIAAGEPWDLGHDDVDRARYTGPEHRRCNRATASHGRVRRSRAW